MVQRISTTTAMLEGQFGNEDEIEGLTRIDYMVLNSNTPSSKSWRTGISSFIMCNLAESSGKPADFGLNFPPSRFINHAPGTLKGKIMENVSLVPEECRVQWYGLVYGGRKTLNP